MRILTRPGVLVVLAAIVACWWTPAQNLPPIPLVLISIDGMKPDYVLDADKHGLRIPNLRRFPAEGTYASGVAGVLPTVTYPSHTTMVTGVSPTRHGIIANTSFDPFGKNLEGWFTSNTRRRKLGEGNRKN